MEGGRFNPGQGRLRTQVNWKILDDARRRSRELTEWVFDLGPERIQPAVEDKQLAKARAIVQFVEWLVELGREVESPDDRTLLSGLIDQWGRRLEELLRRPLLLPSLKPYGHEDLELHSAAEFVEMLRETGRVEGWVVTERPGDGLLRNVEDFRGTTVIDCRLEGCDLSGSEFGSTSVLLRTTFVDCNLEGVRASDLRSASLRLLDCRLDLAVFQRCSFGNVIIAFSSEAEGQGKSSQVLRAQFPETAFVRCVIEGHAFEDCNFKRASFTDCALDGLVFSRSGLETSVFCDSSLVGTTFSGCRLDDAAFSNCDLEHVAYLSASRSRTERWDRPTSLQNADFTRAFNVIRLQSLQPDHLKQARFSEDDWVELKGRFEGGLAGSSGRPDG